MSSIPTFMAALAIAYSLPGADVVYILHTAGRGISYGMAVAAGFALARACHVFLAAVGLATLLQTVPLAFDLVRFLGSLYLIWLGIGLLRSASDPRDSVRQPTASRPFSHVRTAQKAYLVNLLNPKPLLFCSVLLPQFIQLEHGSVIAQFISLGAVLLLTGIAFDTVWASAGKQLGRWLDLHPKAKRIQQVSFGALLVFIRCWS